VQLHTLVNPYGCFGPHDGHRFRLQRRLWVNSTAAAAAGQSHRKVRVRHSLRYTIPPSAGDEFDWMQDTRVETVRASTVKSVIALETTIPGVLPRADCVIGPAQSFTAVAQGQQSCHGVDTWLKSGKVIGLFINPSGTEWLSTLTWKSTPTLGALALAPRHRSGGVGVGLPRLRWDSTKPWAARRPSAVCVVTWSGLSEWESPSQSREPIVNQSDQPIVQLTYWLVD